MADKLYYQEEGSGALRSWVLSKMLEGAGWAAVVVFGVGVLLYAIHGIGLLLPEQSKQAPDPTPSSMLIAPQTQIRVA